jgi:DNA-binding CsgD family transcriptional regulator
MENIEKKVLQLAEHGEPLKAIARSTGISAQKVRRILILHGKWESETLHEIQVMHDNGMTQAEIAQALEITEQTVNSYLPYTRGMHYQDIPSANVMAIRRYRERRMQK